MPLTLRDKENRILLGDGVDTLKLIPDKSIDCRVTSPPYFQPRDYGVTGRIGIEKTPEEYISKLSSLFREIWRVLKDEGTLWVNIGDSYGRGSRGTANISKGNSRHNYHYNRFPAGGNTNASKSLTAIPFRFALEMINTGRIPRRDIIWAKSSCMPESVKDRFCESREYLFFFVKRPKYYFNFNAALEPASGYDGGKGAKYKGGYKDTVCEARERRPCRGYVTKSGKTSLAARRHGKTISTYPTRLKRDVWIIAPEPSGYERYAMYPQQLVLPCILCGCPEGGIVLDPFMGSGATAVVAKKLTRKYIGCEINSEYVKIAERRIAEINPLFEDVTARAMER